VVVKHKRNITVTERDMELKIMRKVLAVVKNT
jgi:hypothetical protein